MKEIKKLTIRFDSEGLWRVDTNYEFMEDLSGAEKSCLKECIVSLCEDLDVDEEDLYYL